MSFCVSLLLPRLSGWLPYLESQQRFDGLEKLITHSIHGQPLARDLDELRCSLFGLPLDGKVPVAALSQLAGTKDLHDDDYFLRLDPVTLQADMSRVMLLGSGLNGFDAEERADIEHTIQTVLELDKLRLIQGDGDFWCIALTAPLPVCFSSLDDALGGDVADFLPEQAEAKPWIRLMTEIQMALYACATNQRRRNEGRTEINSVWFWGGGCLPTAASTPAFQHVYSSEPVSQGLAKLHSVDLYPLAELPAEGQLGSKSIEGSILIDWATLQPELQVNPEKLEKFLAGLMPVLKKQGGSLNIYSLETTLRWPAGPWRRFWNRPRPLREQLERLQAN